MGLPIVYSYCRDPRISDPQTGPLTNVPVFQEGCFGHLFPTYRTTFSTMPSRMIITVAKHDMYGVVSQPCDEHTRSSPRRPEDKHQSQFRRQTRLIQKLNCTRHLGELCSHRDSANGRGRDTFHSCEKLLFPAIHVNPRYRTRRRASRPIKVSR